MDPFEPDHSFDFGWPSGVSLKSKYRLIGNSVNVEVSGWLMDVLPSSLIPYRSSKDSLITCAAKRVAKQRK